MSSDIIEQSMGIMRGVMPMISQYGLAATPSNYAVLYSYVAHDNDDLRKVFDKHIEEHDEITNELCEQWFKEHVCVADEAALLEAQDELKLITENVLDIIANVNGQNDKYADSLLGKESLLEKKPSFDGLRDMIKGLREETVSMRETSQKMRSELNDKLGEVSQLRDSLENIKHEASMDDLTGIANRKGLRNEFSELLERNTGTQCFAMIDIDFFKKFNDTFGHLVGDKVLRFVANTIKNSIKGSDLVARYGGEEFVVIFSATEIDNAAKAAENIRKAIAGTRFVLRKEKQDLGNLSVSIGVSEYQQDEPFEDCLDRADKALYEAKQTGRNRVVINNPSAVAA